LRDSAAANSLRRWAGGANEEAAPRAREFHPTTGLDGLLAVEPRCRRAWTPTTTNGFSVRRSAEPHAPSTNSTCGSITDQLFGGSITEGPAPAFRPLPARSTLLRGQLTTSPVPGYWPRPSLDSAPRGALRPFLGHSAKMPRIRFYNRRFASRAPMTNITSGDLHRAPWETRRRSTSRSPFGARRTGRTRFLRRRRTILRSSGLQRLRA
jgi:hypothetical protein